MTPTPILAPARQLADDATLHTAASPGPVATADQRWQHALQSAERDAYAAWFQPPPESTVHPGLRSQLVQPTVVRAPVAGRQEPSAAAEATDGRDARFAESTSDVDDRTYGAPLSGLPSPLQSSCFGMAGASADALLKDFSRPGVDLTVAVGDRASSVATQLGQKTGLVQGPGFAEPSLLSASLPPGVEPEADTARTSSSTLPGGPARPSQRQDPLRVHVEWTASGVAIWLGADSNYLQEAEMLASRMRQWLEARGERVVDVVCNGRSVDQPPAMPEENAPVASAFPIKSTTQESQ